MVGSSFACSASISDLRANGVPSPTYVDSNTPILSWSLIFSPLPMRPAAQAAYRVVASAGLQDLLSKNYSSWDSGWINSSSTIAVSYNGSSFIADGSTVYWSVLIVDAFGATCDSISLFSVGILIRSPSDFDAFFNNGGSQWIGESNSLPVTDCDSYLEQPAPLLRKEFLIPVGEILDAHLFVSGLGLYEAHINGERVGDLIYDPAWTQYEKRVIYSAYNVIRTGENNAIGIELGRGFFDPLPMRLFGAFNLRESLTVGPPRALAYLLVLLKNGTRVTIGTDTSWRVGHGELRRNNVYIGVQSDLRLSQKGWTSPGFNDSTWLNAVLSTTSSPNPLGPLQLRRTPGVKVTTEFSPMSIKAHPGSPNNFIVSFPKNMAGVVRLQNVSVDTPGAITRLLFAESLTLSGDDIDTRSNLAGDIGLWEGGNWGECAPVPAIEIDNVTWSGSGDLEMFEPKFTWHAFQHVLIEGWPSKTPPGINNIVARMFHEDNDNTGNTFSSWDFQHNEIDELAQQSFKSNWAGGIQSDCPGRERLGYGGDLLAAADAAMMSFDLRTFYAKRVRDYGDSQRSNGGLPETAPFMGIASCDNMGGGTGPIPWGAAHLTLALQIYSRYGDLELIQESFANTRKWLQLINTSAIYSSDGSSAILTSGLADVFGNVADCNPSGCSCPLLSLMGTVFLYQQTEAAVTAAKIIGASIDEISSIKAISTAAQRGFLSRFFDNSTGIVGIGGIDETLWALWSGIIPEEIRLATWSSVSASLRNNGTHIYTGALGTSMLFALGPENGLNDIILEALQKRDFPGYGWQLDCCNSTTLFEHWDVVTPWGGNLASRNHAWFGSVAAYFRRSLAGISLNESISFGYSHIIIKPHIPSFNSTACQIARKNGLISNVSPLPWANATLMSIKGLISSSWMYEQSGLNITIRLFVILPGNANALIYVPRPLLSSNVIDRGACSLAGASILNDTNYDVYDLGDFAGECDFFITSLA